MAMIKYSSPVKIKKVDSKKIKEINKHIKKMDKK